MMIFMTEESALIIVALAAFSSAVILSTILYICCRKCYVNGNSKIPHSSYVRSISVRRMSSTDTVDEGIFKEPDFDRRKKHHNVSTTKSVEYVSPASPYETFSFTHSFSESISTEKPQAPISPVSPRTPSMHRKLDPSQLDPSSYMYKEIQTKKKISLQGPCFGIMNFSLKYNPEMGLLTINLIQARNLEPREFSGTADPYCKVLVVPYAKGKVTQSKVQRKTTAPIFKENFVFEIPEADIHRQTVRIELYDYDQFSRDECIGEVLLPLANVNLTEKVEVWKEILYPNAHPKISEDIPDIGDLMFSIAFLPSAERLTVVIMKARNLQQIRTADGKKTASPYVKVSLYFVNKRLKKKKTSTKHNTVHPVFNEALVFSVQQTYLKHLKMEFQVMHENKLGQNTVIGRVEVSPDAQGEELAHWNDMISSSKPVARWHRLVT